MKKYLVLLLISFLFISLSSDTFYTVKKGDTLYSLSRKYSISVNELLSINNLSSSTSIKIGQKLIIKKDQNISTTFYTVKRGDTLFSIAKSHSVNVNELKKVNNLWSSNIKIGQKLNIPGNSSTSTVVTNPRVIPKVVNNKYLWPHSGPREKLTGKLKGSQISGSIGDKIKSVSIGKVVWVAP